MGFLSARKKKTKVKTGPLYYEEGTIPYDYIIVIDAGSKGSRVYVYNWINPTYALEHEFDFKVNVHTTDNISTATSDTSSGSPSSFPSSPVRFPQVSTEKKWHRKIVPGISSFSSSPQKIGKHHLRSLLQLASAVVPKSQHHRTPIFVHSTAGMRLLTPTDQQQILDSICSYITSNSDFYLPECSTHVDVLSGDVEGLYGWLSINYMNGALDFPERHQHGKNHTTYGLLDMGGASTQVVFQPNSSEITEHANFLYKIRFSEVPVQGEPQQEDSTDEKEHEKQSTEDASPRTYSVPQTSHYDVFSNSFLGFGMYQARYKFLSSLVAEYKEQHEIYDEEGYVSRLRMPVPDPCLPIGYTTSIKIKDVSFDFTGESNFQKCMEKIFPVLLHNGQSSSDGACKHLSQDTQVSSCLMNDLIPAFDFDVNHFIAVSGYWDAINNLLSYDTGEFRPESEQAKVLAEAGLLEDMDYPKSKRAETPVFGKIKKETKHDDSPHSDSTDPKEDTYDYAVIYKKTSDVCANSFNSLMQLNDAKIDKYKLEEQDLAELCFKSSWILNFLHLGLGFPRFGIDESPVKDNKFKSLQLVEEVAGSPFSWTLGRAILYANDEYIQAFNNFTLRHSKNSQDGEDHTKKDEGLIERPGFFHTASPNAYLFGAEQNGIAPRPEFVHPRGDEKYHFYEYENKSPSSNRESVWKIQPHRWYGIFIFMFLSGLIVWLMVGSDGRRILFAKVRSKTTMVTDKILGIFGKKTSTQYSRVDQSRDMEAASYELDSLPREGSSQFKIDSDEDNR